MEIIFSGYIINMDYVLRLQALDGYSAKFNDVFTDRFSRVLYVHHTGKKGDNPHYHFCFTCDYKKDALRKYFKGHFNLATGNKHLSLKDWDGSVRACAYLYHEGTQVTNFRGFTDQEIEEFKMINKDVKSKQVKIPAILEKVIERKRNYKVYDHDFSKDSFYQPDLVNEKRDIFLLIMDELRKSGDWIPNKFQMERYINRVQMALVDTPVDFRRYTNDLYNEWFARF